MPVIAFVEEEKEKHIEMSDNKKWNHNHCFILFSN